MNVEGKNIFSCHFPDRAWNTSVLVWPCLHSRNQSGYFGFQFLINTKGSQLHLAVILWIHNSSNLAVHCNRRTLLCHSFMTNNAIECRCLVWVCVVLIDVMSNMHYAQFLEPCTVTPSVTYEWNIMHHLGILSLLLPAYLCSDTYTQCYWYIMNEWELCTCSQPFIRSFVI